MKKNSNPDRYVRFRDFPIGCKTSEMKLKEKISDGIQILRGLGNLILIAANFVEGTQQTENETE